MEGGTRGFFEPTVVSTGAASAKTDIHRRRYITNNTSTSTLLGGIWRTVARYWGVFSIMRIPHAEVLL